MEESISLERKLRVMLKVLVASDSSNTERYEVNVDDLKKNVE